MPLPPGLSTVTVTGTYKHPDGTPLKGKLLFTPEPAILTSATHGTLLLGTVEATPDAEGDISVTLLATDDADVTPTGWTYRVQERWYDAPGRSYPLALPAAAPAVDLADVAPTAPATGEYVVVTGPIGPQGPAGPTGPQGATGSQPPLGAAGAGADIALRSTDPSTTNARTPTAHAATHAAAGADPVTLTQEQITGLVAALAALAPLAGATFTGPVAVDDANFSVLGVNKGYRFRPLGARLDCEATGSDWMFSVFSGTAFDGTQRTYLRLESGTRLAHACGKWIFTDTADSAAVHTIDPVANQLGFHGATPVAKQTVTGSRGGNAALANLLTALANLGLITDNTTA
jgi:hypothetical protein